ncbi:MAG: TSUP family transporter [Alphaproteobacteria bacterium]|nr:TSUP family transporter [Alphaproteobacteria bacterium]
MTLLPEGIGAVAAVAVIVSSFFTAAVTAAFGIGGGLLLLAIMGGALPPLAVVPVHGVAQLASNTSRLAILRRDVVWPAIGWFVVGSMIGATIGAKVYVSLPPWLLRLGVGVFVLVTTWGPKPAAFQPGPRTFAGVGAVGSFLSMFFGATGPIAAAMLAATGWDRMRVVATHAAAMTAQHGIKSLAFGAIGFTFAPWAAIITGIVVAGVAGSWVGARILKRLPEATFQRGFKLALTVAATYLIVRGLIDASAARAE